MKLGELGLVSAEGKSLETLCDKAYNIHTRLKEIRVQLEAFVGAEESGKEVASDPGDVRLAILDEVLDGIYHSAQQLEAQVTRVIRRIG